MTTERIRLGHILDGLRALGVISCTMDQFSLSFESQGLASQVYCLKPKKRNLPLQRRQTRYVVFVCGNCGAAVGSVAHKVLSLAKPATIKTT